MLVASAQDEAGMSDAEDFSNGRLEIFRSYMDNWNATGHTEMGVLLPDGSISVHAHNTYLQVIHDHGLIVGIYFLCFGAGSICLMFAYAIKRFGRTHMLYCRWLSCSAFASRGWWNGCSIPAIRSDFPRWRCLHP